MATYQYSYVQSTRAPLFDPFMCGEVCANRPLSLTSFSSLGGAEWTWVERACGFMNCITTAGFGWGSLMEPCGVIASKYYSARRTKGLVRELSSKTVGKREKGLYLFIVIIIFILNSGWMICFVSLSTSPLIYLSKCAVAEICCGSLAFKRTSTCSSCIWLK